MYTWQSGIVCIMTKWNIMYKWQSGIVCIMTKWNIMYKWQSGIVCINGKVNSMYKWKSGITYDLLYMLLYLRSKVMGCETERLYMTLYTCRCFIDTLVMAWTVSEILAQIDHKCPNRTFMTLNMTFRVIV